ncbi:transglycosylase SLT domain-containing protein [Asticcacaulis solisilvae]|uniref:transglycosylase SLT domain-containing protein n=1 Tax=Asticcacaulis solisilvae TaxID=1217274 RepID=UPI003FD892BB
MTVAHRLLSGSPGVRQGRIGVASLFGASLFALALAASPVCAKETHKAEAEKAASKTHKSTKTADAGEEKSSKASGKKTTKLAASDDDDTSKKTRKSGTAKAADEEDSGKGKKGGKLAEAEAAKSSKKGKSKTDLADEDSPKAKGKHGKSSDVASDDDDAPKAKGKRGKTTEIASDDDARPAKKGSKAAELEAKAQKTVKGKHGKTELASDDDDAPVKKGSKKAEAAEKGKHGKTTELADDDARPAKKGSKKTEVASDDDDAPKAKAAPAAPAPVKAAVVKVAVRTVPAQKASTFPISLASLATSLQRLPQSLFNQPGQQTVAVAPVPVKMNTAPVPYARIRTQNVNTTGVLTQTDAQLYQAAFAQIDGSDYDGAEATLAQVNDRSLVGYAEYHKLFSGGYSATYEELTAWLSQYGDQPVAMKVWTLAKRKKPAGAPDPAFPSLVGNQAVAAANVIAPAAVQLSGTGSLTPSMKADYNPGAPQLDTADSDLTPKSARSAYNNGQMEQAVTLARKIGDHWVAGLADWRLKRYDQAMAEFKFVATDPSRNAWSQSSGAYWAGRCALKLNDSAGADTYFKIAASFPFTFYGLLAEARLGVTPAVALAKKGLPPTFQGTARDALTASLDDDFAWAKDNTQARRLNALVQIGRTGDAQVELQTAMQKASDDTARDHWMALAAYNNIPVSQLTSSDRLFNASLYPIPAYKLRDDGGVDSALVYAFARKESKFNANARSYAGAYGLLQLMPSTAALVENDPSFNSKPSKLLKPATNLRVGQKYIQRLMDSKPVGGDLLRTIAAYNGGPGVVKDAVNSLGPDADALLVMESIPVAETRQYVEEVAANYWIYRQLMGKETPSLNQAAGDARIIDPTVDADPRDVAMADTDDQ